ncbi:MAG: DegT/DnrJ/EryC1/StrS family aminotransferase [Chloroflexota bacterium]
MYVAADPLLTSASLFGAYDLNAESLLNSQIRYGAPFYTRGRVGLWAVLQSMNIGTGDEVLLPAFICDSVIGPIESTGAKPTFFRTGPMLEISAQDVGAAISAKTRAVLIPHYYGIPTALDEISTLCEQQGIWLIEDCAHALYSFDGTTPLGRRGHAAIFSPWKTLPLPDGGILVINDDRLVRPDPLPEHSPLRLAANMAYRILPTIESAIGWSPRLALLARGGLRDSIQERDRSPDFRREAGSDFSYQMLERADGALVRQRRRSNFERLAKAVASQPYLQALISVLGNGVCPLGLPVLCRDREQARRHFLHQGINVRAYWERLPREVDMAEFPDAHQISRQILILPVHQSLIRRQIEHVVRAIESLPGGASE